MTVREWLEKMFGSGELDKELEPNKEPTKDEVKKEEVKEDKKEEVKPSQSKVEQVRQEEIKKEEVKEEETMDIFEMGWFDEKTGSIDLSKIKNPEVKSALEMISGRYNAEKQARIIQDAIGAEIANYALTIKADTLHKMLDTSGVKINDKGEVVGVKDAIENLKKAEPGLFKDKDKVSSPLNEGFNPVQRSTNSGVPGSFLEAIAQTNEILGNK